MRNNLDFWQNICPVKYAFFRNLEFCYIFYYIYIHLKILGYIRKYYQQFSSGLYTCFSQMHSHFYHVPFVPASVHDVIDFDSLLLYIYTNHSYNMYDSCTNTKILTRKWCICSARWSAFFAYVYVFSFCKCNNN